MEAAPPSYETATMVDYWDIIARYMPSADLCSAALVCSRWHKTFAPHLWGNPASHFGIQNDAVYVALTRFKRTLQTARLLVRSLTHTLNLPPAHAELYNGPQADWLRDLIERLPNLQSLIVRGLPFFDYAALQALILMRKQPGEARAPSPGLVELPASAGGSFASPMNHVPSFSLRLLDASRCPNVTSSSLAIALSRFENLLYLDLSYTYPARDHSVLATFRTFSGLQVLKLRGISLRDENLEVMCKSIGLKVRSLDVRENHLTDRAVRTLFDNCFMFSPQSVTGPPNAAGPRSPTLLPYLGSEMLEIYQGEDFEGYLRNAFTGRFVSRLAIEDAPPGGITHLYIAENSLTVEGVSGLVRSGRLHVLDVGTIAAAKIRHHSVSDGEQWHIDSSAAGAEKLVPVFSKHAADAMTFLRIDHGLITREAPRRAPEEAMAGRIELAGTSLPLLPRRAVELESTSTRPEFHELPAEPQAPRYELEAGAMRAVASSVRDDTYRIEGPQEFSKHRSEVRRGSAFAPEVNDMLAKNTHLSPMSAMEDGRTTMTMTATGFPGGVSPSANHSPSVTPPRTARPRSYSSMASERTARLNAHTATGHTLHPAMLPHVSTLVLTGVPPFSSNKDVADRIIRFVQNCAVEASHARSQAQLDYALPPGRNGQLNELQISQTRLFALKRLVLEMAPQNVPRSKRASPWHQHNREPGSMADDRDIDALWDSAANDFSFFGEEETMFPTIDGGRITLPGTTEKEVSFGQPAPARNNMPSEPVTIDNISLISAFRKERKSAYDRNVAAGNTNPQVEGMWPGVVQVVRSNATMRSDEQMDYYGNKFVNHYLYR